MRFEAAERYSAQVRNDAYAAPGTTVHLPLDAILSDPLIDHARIVAFDELAALTEQIAVYGLPRPIRVREIGGFYQAISDRKLLKAAAMAGFTHVPCTVESRQTPPSDSPDALRTRQGTRAYFAQLAALRAQQTEPPAPSAPPRKPRTIIRDVRLLTNTVHRACRTLTDSGMKATVEQTETENELCLVVRVAKPYGA